ncbi:MAG: TonB family protein [Pseudomonadota bacterium]
MIRNSIIVAALAVLLSVLLHATGLMALFDAGTRVEQEAPPEPPDSAAFEDFAEEALEPEEPEPAQEIEPEELIEPEEFTDIRVASDNPQNVEAPDIGTETVNQGRIETEEVAAAEPPSQRVAADVPQGNPEAPLNGAEVQPDEAREVVEAVESEILPEAPIETLDAESPDITVETLQEQGDVEAAEAEDVLTSAVTRSVRPPPTRPSEETFGAEDGSEDVTEQPGLATELAQTQRTGLDLLAEAGATAIYGRESPTAARATGNATDTNYAGKVFTQLNRSLPVYRNEKGFAKIRIQILPDGQVGWIRVIGSSGSPSINVAAAANVRKAAPFPRPPDGKAFELVVNFVSR